MKLDLNLDNVKDAVKGFGLDVWEDLSRTRLSGVAVGLAVALLMITATVVLRPGGASDVVASSPIIAPAPPEEDEISFSVPSDEPMRLADVDLSAPRDPFQSLDGFAASGQTLLPAGEEIVDSVMSSGSTAGSTSTVPTTDDTSALMPLDDLSTTPTSTPTPSDEPEGDFGNAEEPHEPAQAPLTDYSYTADVQFGPIDNLERYATVQRLGLIPSRQEPLIMYLGVTSDDDTAVFMVDSRLSQGGEGRCVPRDSLCTFLELQLHPAHDEHHFIDPDGNEYLLRLRGLTRTTNSSGSVTGRDVAALHESPPVVDGER